MPALEAQLSWHFRSLTLTPRPPTTQAGGPRQGRLPVSQPLQLPTLALVSVPGDHQSPATHLISHTLEPATEQNQASRLWGGGAIREKEVSGGSRAPEAVGRGLTWLGQR